MIRTGKSSISAALFAMIALGLGSNAWSGELDIAYDSSNFDSNQKSVDNEYWPLAPGATKTTFIYLGATEDGCVFDKIVADPTLPKTIGPPYNIDPLVVVDTEWETEMECDEIIDELGGDLNWEPGEGLNELTFDWYVEDLFENIWYMGEDSRDFGDFDLDGVEVSCPSVDEVPLGTARENWELLYGFSDEYFLECTGGSWEAGQPGPEEGDIGIPGIIVPSDMPYGDDQMLTVGTTWQQEVAEGAEDMAKLLKIYASLSVEDDDYEECRKVKEWNPYEPGASVEHKWYCKDGPGLVLTEGVGGGPTEEEVLVVVF